MSQRYSANSEAKRQSTSDFVISFVPRHMLKITTHTQRIVTMSIGQEPIPAPPSTCNAHAMNAVKVAVIQVKTCGLFSPFRMLNRYGTYPANDKNITMPLIRA